MNTSAFHQIHEEIDVTVRPISRWEGRVYNYLLRVVAPREDALDPLAPSPLHRLPENKKAFPAKTLDNRTAQMQR